MSQTTKNVLVVKEGFDHQVGPVDKRKTYRVGDELEITDIVGWPEGCFEKRLNNGFLGFKTTLVDALVQEASGGAPKKLEDMTKEELANYAKDVLSADVDVKLSKPAMVEEIRKLEKAAEA